MSPTGTPAAVARFTISAFDRSPAINSPSVFCCWVFCSLSRLAWMLFPRSPRPRPKSLHPWAMGE